MSIPVIGYLLLVTGYLLQAFGANYHIQQQKITNEAREAKRG
jgi:hypothetical protein